MPTRRLAHGRTVARNAHPRLRLSAAPLRHNPAVSVRCATDAGRSQQRSVRLSAVRATPPAPGLVADPTFAASARGATPFTCPLIRTLNTAYSWRCPPLDARRGRGRAARWTVAAGRGRTNGDGRMAAPRSAGLRCDAVFGAAFTRPAAVPILGAGGERASVGRLDAALSGLVRTVWFAASGDPGCRRGPEHRRRGATLVVVPRGLDDLDLSAGSDWICFAAGRLFHGLWGPARGMYGSTPAWGAHRYLAGQPDAARVGGEPRLDARERPTTRSVGATVAAPFA